MADFDIISYILLPLLIFLARVADVTVATVKLMFVVNNARRTAAFLGFFEALITIIALSRIMQDASNFLAIIMYAAGFATGTYAGMYIEEKMAYGSVLIRIISKQIQPELLSFLVKNRYHYSMVDANDQSGNTQILFTVCKRSNLHTFLSNLETIDPGAIYTIESVKQVSEVFLKKEKRNTGPYWLKWLIVKSKRTKAMVFHH